MPGTRVFDVDLGLHQAAMERMSRWSDIQEYLPFLYNIARSYPRARVLELGSRQGNSTLAFLAGVQEVAGHVWSCDINDIARDPEGMMPWTGSSLWTFVHGDDMDPAVQEKLPAVVDILFVDTSHEYEHTVREIDAYLPRVAPAGVALFHDTRFILKPWDTVPPVGTALNEWCARTGKTWVDLAGRYGLGILRPWS